MSNEIKPRSNLILLEGLPSTGKSTNSRIIWSQLERNGYSARWIHEVARPHPTLFFYEACLDKREYRDYIKRYPQTYEVLERIKKERTNTIGIDLLEIKWNYMDVFRGPAFEKLALYDVWKFPLHKYMEVALEKWEYFVHQVKQDPDQIMILDSSIFQFQIYTFLLEDAPHSTLLEFMNKIFGLIAELNPKLMYLYRENIEDTIAYLEWDRGSEFMETIWDRDKYLPYYQNRPSGAEGYREFLRDYQLVANELFQITPFDKIGVEITAGDWSHYNRDILSFLDLMYYDDPQAVLQYGTYLNQKLNARIVVEGLTMIDPTGKRKQLIPKSKNEFYIKDIPVVLYFETPETLVILGEQICDRWTTYGEIYIREIEK